MRSAQLDPADTIAAIASPGGPGPRGIVRVSGPDAWPVALGGFREIRGNPNLPTRPELRSGRLWLDELDRSIPASVALWPAPRTYTGQPLAELHASGSPPLLRSILAGCLARGARLAEPGEFTLRAFLSGRIDLTRAEAVLGVIDATTPEQLDAALRQLAGGLASPITALRDRLADILAHLEANLDFAEEPDVDPLGARSLADSLDAASAEVASLAGRLRGRDRPDARPRVALVGPPNAGKSRLFNALIGEGRAIVSPVPGTTRDYLEAPCDCDGLAVDLVDTAGIETPRSAVDASAQKTQGEQSRRADLRLDCRPPGDPADLDPAEAPAIVVRTKSDLAPGFSDPGGAIVTSASTGEGVADLRRAIAQALRSRAQDGDLPAGTSARCGESLARAGGSLASAAEGVRLGLGDELVAVDLRQALDDLGRVVGTVVADDLLDRIFRRFCIGK